MSKHKRNELGFSAFEVLLILIIIGLIGFVGWYVWHHKAAQNKTATSTSTPTKISPDTYAGWKTYTNTCSHYTLKAPATVSVTINVPNSTGSCGDYSGAGAAFYDYKNIDEVTIQTQTNRPLAGLTSGLSIQFLKPQTPRNGTLVADFLKQQDTNKDSGATSTKTIITSSYIENNKHQELIITSKNPDNKPSDFQTVDTPYCPCTRETVYIDTGSNSYIEIDSGWLNSDTKSGNISNAIILSTSLSP